MRRDDIEQYEGTQVKIILKGLGNIYHGKIIKLTDRSLVLHDKFDKEVTIDYEMVGLITPIREAGE